MANILCPYLDGTNSQSRNSGQSFFIVINTPQMNANFPIALNFDSHRIARFVWLHRHTTNFAHHFWVDFSRIFSVSIQFHLWQHYFRLINHQLAGLIPNIKPHVQNYLTVCASHLYTLHTYHRPNRSYLIWPSVAHNIYIRMCGMVQKWMNERVTAHWKHFIPKRNVEQFK